ncbi:hypothetical protein [Streptomyces inhibens]|nr:hypothetical protein [Streptomyces inhibens]
MAQHKDDDVLASLLEVFRLDVADAASPQDSRSVSSRDSGR